MIESPFFLSEALVQALGWTLLHSLWQGAAVAALLWLILPRLKKSGQRYWISYAGLLSILLTAVVSFVWVYNTQKAPAPLEQGLAFSESVGFQADFMPAASSPVESSFWTALTEWLEPYQPLIVSIWLLGLLFFLIQFAGGLHFMYRLRRRQNRLVEPAWQEKLQELAARIGFSRPVRLLESALVKVPMALGFFKPLILLPLGMINQLSPEQVEAILAHELAHIARRDWLFNLLQALIEAVFYFHPAVWWISGVIRAERENCCDDTAVALTGNRLAYAKTLVFLQDIARVPASPSLALSMQGAPQLLRRRPLLLQRIKRILHQPQQSTSLMEKTIALAILVALISLWTLRANTPPALVESIREIAEKPMTWLGKTPAAALAFQAAGDTVPKPKERQKIVREDDNQRVEMELENGQIVQLKIDGKEIKSADYSQYQSLTDELRSEAIPPPPPPAPNAPTNLWFERAPAPPSPSFPARSSSRVSTEKDGSGNTIIRVERNGKPMEIKVKNGEVWVNDKKVEDGESLDIPGEGGQSIFWNDGNRSFRVEGNRMRFMDENGGTMEFPQPENAPNIFHFDTDGDHFIFKGQDGATFEMPEIRFSEDELLHMQEGALLEQRKALKEVEKQMKEHEKEWKKNRKEWSKEQQEQYKALEEARRSMQDARRSEKEVIERLHRNEARTQHDSRRAHDDQRIIIRETRRGGESVSTSLQNALLKDKLISDADNYSLDLSSKNMKVNGKKQPDNIHEKYLELYRRKTGKDMGKDKIRIEVKN